MQDLETVSQNLTNSASTQETLEALKEYYQLTRELTSITEVNKLQFFHPYKKFEEFFEMGRTKRERAIFAGNRVGKTTHAGAETAMHLTGKYPNWWKGHRFDTAIRAFVIGYDLEQMRGSSQLILFGEEENWGNGLIPRECLLDEKGKSTVNERDKPKGVIDYARVKHVTGDWSMVWVISQKQDWGKIMGYSIHLAWVDEEGDNNKMYNQLLPRVADTRGLIVFTATPERGRTPTVKRFMNEKPAGSWYTHASLYDAEHFTKEEIEEIINSYPENERPFRVEGIPVFGSGLIYPFSRNQIGYDPRNVTIEWDWPRIAAIDPGFQNSRTSILWAALDPSTAMEKKDMTMYVYALHNTRKEDKGTIRALPAGIAPFITGRDKDCGFKIPMAWPKDANQAERSTGQRISEEYLRLGVRMLSKPAFLKGKDGKDTYFVLDGINAVHERLSLGKLKISLSMEMQPLWEELFEYSIDEDGKIINKGYYDNLDALRYIVSMRQYASSENPMIRNYGNNQQTKYEGWSLQ